MLVDDLRRHLLDGRCELSARVRTDDGRDRRLWFRFPEELAPQGALDASPFLSGVLFAAMRAGEDLEVAHPVSARLLEQAEEIVGVMQSMFPAQMRAIRVEAEGVALEPGREMTASFFTRGVDSWYAALSAREDDPQDPPLTHAVFSPGFLSGKHGEAVVRDKTESTAETAHAAGLEVIDFDTNLKRDFGGSAQLVSAAQALGISRVLIPSGPMRGEMRPSGTHVVLDHRFSTERTEIVHYGDASRLEKVRRIARSDLALDTLRVCRLDRATEDGNCGRCEKCVRTMMELHVVGALDRCRSFERPLEPRTVAAVTKQLKRSNRHQWVDLLSSLGESRFDRRLKAAIRLVIARSDLLTSVEGLKELAPEPELAGLDPRLPASVERSTRVLARSYEGLGSAFSPGPGAGGRAAQVAVAFLGRGREALARHASWVRRRPAGEGQVR